MAVTGPGASVRGVTLADAWRSFRTAIGLGWAIEANWSDPFLFAVYTLAKPLAAAGILIVMFQVITQGADTGFLQFLIVGSALWNVVFGVMAGLVQSILEDRERYRMLKYVVVTPASLFPFLLGRSLARVLVSFVAVALTLLVGIVFLGVELRPNFLFLVPATMLGVLAVIGLGIFMAGWCLQLRQEAWHYPEAIAGRSTSISGAIFPIDVLPSILHPIAYAPPTTWWLEASRRGLLGHGSPGVIGELSDGMVMLLLVVTTAVAIPLGARRVPVVHAAGPPGRRARHGDRALAHQLVVVGDHEGIPAALDAFRDARFAAERRRSGRRRRAAGHGGSARTARRATERRGPAGRRAQAVAEELVLGDVGGGLLGEQDPQRAVALEPCHGRIGPARVAGAIRVELGVPAGDVQLLAPPPSAGDPPSPAPPHRQRVDLRPRAAQRPDHEQDGHERAERATSRDPRRSSRVIRRPPPSGPAGARCRAARARPAPGR